MSCSSKTWRTTSWWKFTGPARTGFGIRFGRSYHSSNRHEPGGLARPGNIQFVGRCFAAGRCRICAALPRSGRGLLGQQRIIQLLFERRLRRAAGARALRLLHVDFNPILQDGQRHYPVTVAVRHSLQPKHVYIHWTTDNWRNTQVTPCFFYRTHWDKWRRSGARNPNRYDTSIWISQIRIDDAFRVQYAIGCDTPHAGRSGTTISATTTWPAAAG